VESKKKEAGKPEGPPLGTRTEMVESVNVDADGFGNI
jgi:hypothetical protein